MKIRFGWFLLLPAVVAAWACSGSHDKHVELPPSVVVPFRGYFQSLASGSTQTAALCARGNQDRFAQWYCGTHPTITSIDDVLIGLGLKDPASPFSMNFAMTGQSASIVGRFTTPINPRVIVFSPVVFGTNQGPSTGGGSGGVGDPPFPTGGLGSAGNFVAFGYTRGNELAEIAAFDPTKQDVNFYLLKYTQSCDPNCSNVDLYTPKTESGWVSVTVYGDADLQNTPLDCLQCHEPGGKGAPRILRMQERQFPWMHWFGGEVFEGGGVPPTNTADAGPIASPTPMLEQKFLNAHQGEDYGGVPSQSIFGSAPFNLEGLIESAGYAPQPNEFDSGSIQSEGRGAIWEALYANAVAGQAISVPFYDSDPTDPRYLAEATRLYMAIRAGGDASIAPDMSAVFAEQNLGDLGFRATDSAKDGLTVVQHRCGTCHDGRFPGISRNNFDWHDFPNNLPAGERDKILMRIRLTDDNVYKMPPTLFSSLTEHQKQLIEQALGK